MSETSAALNAPSRALRTTAVLAWLRMARVVSRTHRASGERLRRWDLSLAQFDVIAQVGAAPGLTQQELAQRRLVTQGNICQLLNGLERTGFTERRRAGRSKRLFLTPKGRALFHQVVPEQEAWQAERLSPLTEGEQHELLRLLRKLERGRS